MDGETERALKRVLGQHLESWQRAGLTHLSASPPAESAAAADPMIPAPHLLSAVIADPALTVGDSVVSSHESSLRMPPGSRSKSVRPARTPSASPAPHAELPGLAPGSNLSLEERSRQLTSLAECVAGCTRCPELARTRKQTVFGVGNPQARILFLGEAPGADEDDQGIPFVGRAGQLLDRIIVAAKLNRAELYICNVLRCRPPGNRTPLPDEAANCREWLDGQIAIVDPEYIVCWGACAAQNLLGVTESIGKLRGRFLQHGRAKVLCTYHPSYLLRNPPAKKQVWEDMQILMAELGIPLDPAS